jgi:integration host factor subunit alpha
LPMWHCSARMRHQQGSAGEIQRRKIDEPYHPRVGAPDRRIRPIDFLGSCGRNVALVQYLIGPMSGKTVTRADLHQAIYQKFGLSRTQSATLVELVLKEITDCLERGETVKLSRLGSFLVRKKGQRMGRNPRTGEEVPISPRRVVVFKPSAVLKQRINAPGAPSP